MIIIFWVNTGVTIQCYTEVTVLQYWIYSTITGTNPYCWTLTDPRGGIILNKCYNTGPVHSYLLLPYLCFPPLHILPFCTSIFHTCIFQYLPFQRPRTDTLPMAKGVFIATQLNSTELNWPSWTAYSQVSRVFVYDVMTYKLSQLGHYTFIDRWPLFTLWTRRQLDVELSWVELSCVGVAIDTSPTQLNSTWRRVVDTFTAWTTVTYQWT